jgi:hypothetical protein
MKKEIDIQKENIQKLIELASKYPDLRILPLVDSEVVADDSFSSWIAYWGSPEIDYIWNYEGAERIYIKSYDYENLIYEVMDEIDSDCEMDRDKCEKLAKEEVDGYEWEKVILVRIKGCV